MLKLTKIKNRLKQWCDDNLSEIKNPYTKPPKHGKLVYQDWTSCSVSYARSDVYQFFDGKYVVQTDSGICSVSGDETTHFQSTNCSSIIEVMDELVIYSGHDPNTTGELNSSLIFDLKQVYPFKNIKNKFLFFRIIIKEYPDFDICYYVEEYENFKNGEKELEIERKKQCSYCGKSGECLFMSNDEVRNYYELNDVPLYCRDCI